MRNRLIFASVLIGCIIVAAAIYSMRRDRCTPLFGAAISSSQATLESKELLTAMQLLWHNERSAQRHTISIIHNNLPLPKPLKADIVASTATVTLSRKMFSGDFRYADAWYKVYNAHHPAHHCVHMRLQWRGGHIDEKYPVSEF